MRISRRVDRRSLIWLVFVLPILLVILGEALHAKIDRLEKKFEALSAPAPQPAQPYRQPAENHPDVDHGKDNEYEPLHAGVF